VRTIKESCLERMILFGEESLRTAIHTFVAHYHTERNHQGLANRILSPEPGHAGNAGVVQRSQRLGGMLNYYYRAAWVFEIRLAVREGVRRSTSGQANVVNERPSRILRGSDLVRITELHSGRQQ
jgi:hypothetical protein